MRRARCAIRRADRRRTAAWVCSALLIVGCGVTVAGCGDAVQPNAVTDRLLLGAMAEHLFPVYWVGRAFEGMPVTGISRDQSGAFTVTYGVCSQGGQYYCTPPLELITAPDNSFVPGHAPDTGHEKIRGRIANVASNGETLELETSNVVVDVDATSAATAREAITAMEPINMPGKPIDNLPGFTFASGWELLPPEGPPEVAGGPTGTTDGGGAAAFVIGSSL